MKKYAIDTNIISYILKNNKTIINKYRYECNQGNEFVMIPIVYYEINRWLLEKNAIKLQIEFNMMCDEFPLLDTNKNVWDKAAEIYVNTRKKGKSIGSDADLLITAYCIVNNCTLITNNIRHFENIEELNVTNWMQGDV